LILFSHKIINKNVAFSFVNIQTLFEVGGTRDINNLTKVYDQPELLELAIRSASKGILDNQKLITGKKILLKPNWVTHDRKNNDKICLRTNDNILFAILNIIIECKPIKITIGDAPIHGCNWDNLLGSDFYAKIQKLKDASSINIEIKDFRRVTFNPTKNNPLKELNEISKYVIFDLGKDSFLEPISSPKSNFRVTNYNPNRLKESHTIGKHKYCLTKELFDADVVISLPKIKTHQKTAITGALKNIVGMNGDKDFLPHHRVGGQGFGGDCYPGNNILRRTSEYFLDCANRKQGDFFYWFWHYMSRIVWKMSFPKNVHHLSAGWYGNDTSWRMVLDLNKIITYGKMDGTISSTPQREIYSLCDGIIGGQGNGPLNPDPLPLGVICFSNNSVMTDVCFATLMGFDIQNIPILRNAINFSKDQLVTLTINGEKTTLENIKAFSVKTKPPDGWIGHLNKT